MGGIQYLILKKHCYRAKWIGANIPEIKRRKIYQVYNTMSKMSSKNRDHTAHKAENIYRIFIGP